MLHEPIPSGKVVECASAARLQQQAMNQQEKLAPTETWYNRISFGNRRRINSPFGRLVLFQHLDLVRTRARLVKPVRQPLSYQPPGELGPDHALAHGQDLTVIAEDGSLD
jgi:hypothetical protein